MNVKIFDFEHEVDLEEAINDFLADEKVEMVNIFYQTSHFYAGNAVILLAGVCSILGLMNVQLFRMLQAEKKHPVSFAPSETKVVTTEPTRDATGKPELGLTVDSIGELDQRYFHLPAGALITQVEVQGFGAKAGLAVGDIILSLNGETTAKTQKSKCPRMAEIIC